jgi:hypothetical protein
MKVHINKVLVLSMLMSMMISSCIVVKEEEKIETSSSVVLSPKPEIEMSDEIVRSKSGDMIAFLPKGWFLVDIRDRISSDVIAVAVNPEHSLSAVFSTIKISDQPENLLEKEGLMGLARVSLSRHEKKTSGSIRQVGKYLNVELGKNSFVKYDYSSSGGALITRAAVFVSSINQPYEFCIIPMEFTGKPIPPSDEIDKTFRSIMTSIRY